MNLNNTKKKLILGVVLFSALSVTGLQNAAAGPCGGPNRWTGPQCGECYGTGFQGQQQYDKTTIEERDTFLRETAELRKSIAVRKAEKRALMLNDNPDAKRIAQLTGEIFDLHEQLKAKAGEKGLADVGFSRSPGRGCGNPGPRGFKGQY